jgi:hypothetical protein
LPRTCAGIELAVTALRGIAVFLIGTALLLEDSLFAPVFGMVGGIAALALANHERLVARRGAREAAGAAGMAQRVNRAG